MTSAEADVVKAEAQIQEAKASLQQAKDELDVKTELQRRNPGIVPQRDIEKLQVLVDQRQAGVDAATASKTVGDVAAFDAAAGREGERRSGAWPRRRSIWTRPLFAPASTAASSSSWSAPATSSIS